MILRLVPELDLQAPGKWNDVPCLTNEHSVRATFCEKPNVVTDGNIYHILVGTEYTHLKVTNRYQQAIRKESIPK